MRLFSRLNYCNLIVVAFNTIICTIKPFHNRCQENLIFQEHLLELDKVKECICHILVYVSTDVH